MSTGPSKDAVHCHSAVIPVAEYQKIIDILGEEIHAMLRRDKTIKAALTRAQDRIDKMMREAKRY